MVKNARLFAFLLVRSEDYGFAAQTSLTDPHQVQRVLNSSMSETRRIEIQLPGDVMWTQIGDEVAILNSSNGTYFGLDAIGSRIWCLIAQKLSPDEIVATMLSEYAVNEDEVRRDLDELIEKLAQRALIKISNPE